RTLLAGWLYGTACRTAAHARADAARRRGREALAEAGRPSGDPAVEAVARELSAVLDEEVGHLPERYRSPIILCHVEGQTRDEAARRLGCSPRTLQRHLERGRALLRARLGRRGVTLSAALIAPTLWGRPVEAAVSARLASAAVQAAVAAPSITAFSSLVGATAGRAVRLFLLTRTQVALGLLAVACLVGSGVGIAGYGTAEQGLQTPLSVEGNREAAAPDFAPEPRKEDVSVPIDPKRLAQLAEQLRSKNLDERSAALAALEKLVPAKGAGELDFRPVIEPLLDLSGWGGEAEKDAQRAEGLIVRLGGQTTTSLRRRLDSQEAHDRRVAAELLSRVEPPGPGLTDLLRPLLADKDHYVRRAAIQGLGAQGPAAKAAISDLEKESTDPNLPNRVMARVALIHIAGASEERVSALADLLNLKEPCDGAAAYAAVELGKLGRKAKSAAPHLLAALKHTDAQMRIDAAHALGRVGADPDKTLAALIGLLKDDPEREVRRNAAGALGEMGPAAASAIPALREALRGEGGGWWVAADAIGKIGGPDAVHALVEALKSKDDDVRHTAIKRLGALGGTAASAVEALQKARKDDPRASNRKAAAEALKKINDSPEG
ncbi:MAG TPA: HEAT repeat domain-containing protein, partial [Gemmataceae bacterium]|nr:HEAT repeat domain-containing protein [Gemmataceae bacterium]